MGVDLFFVLSGFLIGSQVLRPIAAGGSLDLGDFYRRRAYRILPVFFVVFGLYVFWPAWRETPGMQPWWQFPTFTFNLLFDHPDNYAFSHVWSLCVEEHFYLLFPFIALLMLRKPSARRFGILCGAIVLGGMVLRAWLWLHYYQPANIADSDKAGPVFVRYLYYPTYSRLDGLLAGVVLAACNVFRPAWMARVQRHGNRVLLLGLALLAASIVLFTWRLSLIASIIGYPLLSLALMMVVAAASGGTSWLARFRVPGAGWLAAISYSLYLSHKGVMHLTQHVWGERLQQHGLVLFGVYAVAILAGGAALHYLVERPCLRWRDAARRNRVRADLASDVA
jgi:peptidoglycan/LPS O-acetylase OafA/YrhL